MHGITKSHKLKEYRIISECFDLTVLPDVFDHKEEISVCYSLAEIMFAFAYDKRATLGESTVRMAKLARIPRAYWYRCYAYQFLLFSVCLNDLLNFCVPIFPPVNHNQRVKASLPFVCRYHEHMKFCVSVSFYLSIELFKARFPLGDFVRATRSENNNPAM